jgi:hypothetical protein
MCAGALPLAAAERSFEITRAEYRPDRALFIVRGHGSSGAVVRLSDADRDPSTGVFAQVTANNRGFWQLVQANPAQIPCRVRAESQGVVRYKDVDHADAFAGGCGARADDRHADEPRRTPTATRAATATRTVTMTRTTTRTRTSTATRVPTRTATPTSTHTTTRTVTASRTPTLTTTRTQTRTPTATQTLTQTRTAPPTATLTATRTVSATSTRTPSTTATTTQSRTPTTTQTRTASAAATRTPSTTATTTQSRTPSRSRTPTATATGTQSGAGAMKHDIVVPMNYELGMHCTGFDFSYCCVLPPYNSILAQVIKTEKTAPKAQGEDTDPTTGQRIRIGHPSTLEADPNDNTIVLDADTGRPFRLLYWHEDQRTRAELATVPAGDCPGCDPTTVGNSPTGHILNTRAEGEKLVYWSSYYDLGKGTANIADPNEVRSTGDNFANAVFRHFYIYTDAAGTIPGGTTADSQQLHFGIDIPIAVDTGPAGHALSSTFNPDGTLKVPHYLTFTGKTGTVVYTDSPVTPFDDFPSPRADVVQIDNVPIVLTNPGIWEALGLPLTPFPDGIDLMAPDLTESSVRPYVRMTVEPVDLNNQPILSSSGQPQTFFGDAPIDIPNCERCHSNARANDRADLGGPRLVEVVTGMVDVPTAVASEYDYWRNTVGLSDWYARVKSAAISILGIHDAKHGTGFLKNYDPSSTVQTSFLSRLGRQTVICQDCHADNVIGVLESKKIFEIAARDRGARFTELWGDTSVPGGAGDTLIPALTEAVHAAHLTHSPGYDGQGRTGACQGCHPAHRSDGSLVNYPITLDGLNAFGPEGGNPNGDNRDAAGGCFVGRDVHSNPARYGGNGFAAEIAAGDLNLTAVGQWLRDNVATASGSDKGIWCTNCHTQLQRELYKADHISNAVQPGAADTARDASSLADLATQLNAANGTSLTQQDLINMLDPGQVGVGGSSRSADLTTLAWANAANRTTANIASVSVNATLAKGPDVDGEFNVAIIGLDPNNVPATDLFGNPAPADATLVNYDAADDGRDYWLSPGSPKCADCHRPPYVESLGGVNTAYAVQLGLATPNDLKTSDSGAFPINQPFKYSNFRYSKGHRGITCQGCHESPHGLYPATPPGFVGPRSVDETTWEQAGLLNNDSSHGPIKCASCHETNPNGTVKGTHRILYNGQPIDTDLQRSIAWAHTFTAEASLLNTTCVRCHRDQRQDEGIGCDDLREHVQIGRIAARHANAVATELNLPCSF